ncbi:hypothetical protein R1sor_016027 [Riccia sorocarpa]|uniref:Uncharacterized protein n=1 Tax=Riccia sorocarpa TaxID=122646 RepID=A0ABD3HDT8_9MARC
MVLQNLGLAPYQNALFCCRNRGDNRLEWDGWTSSSLDPEVSLPHELLVTMRRARILETTGEESELDAEFCCPIISGSNSLLGDSMMLVGATLYAIANTYEVCHIHTCRSGLKELHLRLSVCSETPTLLQTYVTFVVGIIVQEFLVKRHRKAEILASLGFFAAIVTICQAGEPPNEPDGHLIADKIPYERVGTSSTEPPGSESELTPTNFAVTPEETEVHEGKESSVAIELTDLSR